MSEFKIRSGQHGHYLCCRRHSCRTILGSAKPAQSCRLRQSSTCCIVRIASDSGPSSPPSATGVIQLLAHLCRCPCIHTSRTSRATWVRCDPLTIPTLLALIPTGTEERGPLRPCGVLSVRCRPTCISVACLAPVRVSLGRFSGAYCVRPPAVPPWLSAPVLATRSTICRCPSGPPERCRAPTFPHHGSIRRATDGAKRCDLTLSHCTPRRSSLSRPTSTYLLPSCVVRCLSPVSVFSRGLLALAAPRASLALLRHVSRFCRPRAAARWQLCAGWHHTRWPD